MSRANESVAFPAKCPNCAWAIKEAHKRKMPMIARWVFVVLAEQVDRKTLEWSGSTCITMLADITGMTRQSVRNALALIPESLLLVIRNEKKYVFKLLRGTTNDVDGLASTVNDVDSDTPSTVNDVDGSLPTWLTESSLSTPEKEESSLRSDSPLTPQKGVDASSSIIDAWNRMAKETGLSPVRVITAKRKAKLAARLKEHGEDGFLEAISRIGASGFCHGNGPTGWKADFDFLLQEQSLIRTLEGRYDDRQQRSAAARGFDPNKLSGIPRALWNLDQERKSLQVREGQEPRAIEQECAA